MMMPPRLKTAEANCFGSFWQLFFGEMMPLRTLAALVLLVSMLPSANTENNILQCPAHGLCRKAFLINNRATLKCGEGPEDTPVFWQLFFGEMMLLRILAALVLLVSMLPSASTENNILQCPAHGLCQKAFLTHSRATLKCGEGPEDTPVFWQFQDPRDPSTKAVTFISSSGPVNLPEGLNTGLSQTISSLMSRAKLPSRDLTIKSPTVEDSGVFICKEGQKTVITYEIDFQDASHIHTSHVNLKQNAPMSTAVDMGANGILEMFNIWSEWQPCDRCRSPGERKRIGYCYAEHSKDAVRLKGPLPCGLLRNTFKEVSFIHPPALQYETCQEACSAKTEVSPTLVLDDYRTLLHADVSFKCSESTIYKPVYWMHGKKSITRLEQILKESPYILDDATGGGTLSVHMINKTEHGYFDCYVDRILYRRFKVIFSDVEEILEPDQYSTAEYILMGFGVFFMAALALSTVRQCLK